MARILSLLIIDFVKRAFLLSSSFSNSFYVNYYYLSRALSLSLPLSPSLSLSLSPILALALSLSSLSPSLSLSISLYLSLSLSLSLPPSLSPSLSLPNSISHHPSLDYIANTNAQSEASIYILIWDGYGEHQEITVASDLSSIDDCRHAFGYGLLFLPAMTVPWSLPLPRIIIILWGALLLLLLNHNNLLCGLH